MPFIYNEYSSLLLVVIAPAMLYALLLLRRGYGQETQSDKVVGWLVFLFALQATSWMLGFAGYYDQSGKTIFMFYFPWRHIFWYGPLVYLFFRSLTERNFQLWQKPNWFHLLPGLFFLLIEVAVAAHDFLLVQVHTLDVIPNDLDGLAGVWLNSAPSWLALVIEILGYLSLFGYFVYTLLLYHRYRKYLQTAFSNDELIHLRWLRNFLAFFLFLIIAIPVIEELAGSIDGMTTYEFSWYGYLLYGLIAYYLGFHAYDNDPKHYKKVAFEKVSTMALAAEQSQNFDQRVDRSTDQVVSHISNEKNHAECFAQIESTLRQQQLYLEPTLTLQELADALGHSSTEVSAAINREAATNFNHYINAWRVKAVKKKLIDPAYNHLSLLGIGLDAGFSSKATFNRAFKQHTGQTPRQFQQENRTVPKST